MRVKFALYGAGNRGRREMDMIGKNNISFFVDSSLEKIGKECYGIPVISPQDYAKISDDYVCVITPQNEVDVIDGFLKSLGVTHIMHEPSLEHIMALYKEHILHLISNRCKGRSVGIYGISAGSLVILEELERAGVERICLIPGTTQTINEFDYLNGPYNINELDEIDGEYDLIVNTESFINRNWKSEEFSIQEIFEETIPFSDNTILGLKDKYLGERCFIVATGPSLKIDDLNILHERHEICISMNRIYNIFDRTNWRPDYYVIEDPMTIRDLMPVIVNLDLPNKFLPFNMGEYWRKAILDRSYPMNNKILPSEEMHRPLFSNNIEKILYCGYTVTYTCLQIAVYLGFKTIYLIGVDYNFSSDIHDACNHFEGYEKDGVTTVNPFFPYKSGLSYQSAREYADGHGIKIYNATRGGKLDFFERKDFDSIF